MSAGSPAPPPRLVLGPLLRHRAPGTACVWVETDRACTVEVAGAAAPTFAVAGAHYALVTVEGVPDDGAPYDVRLDGVGRHPADGEPVPHLGRAPAGSSVRIAVGSCRVTPGTLGAEWERRLGPDGLEALARRVAAAPAQAPDLLLLIGDQVYVDHPGRPRPRDLPGHADVYRRAWNAPAVRALLARVPSATILDDHEVRDGWSPAAGVRGPAERRRLAAALAAYWLYQHLGNLSPQALADDALLAAVRAAPDGAAPLLAAAEGWTHGGAPFAHSRVVGPARLVVMDARARRVRGPAGREIVDGDARRWLEERLRGDVAHLLLVTSVPAYMPPGLHDLEAWGTALADGAWGAPARPLGRMLRRRLGLEHWPSQGRSLAWLTGALRAVARGDRGAPPASIVLLAGEVHHGRVDRIAVPGAPADVPVWHVVSSPLRNRLGRRRRALLRVAGAGPFAAAMRAVARLARVPPGPARPVPVAGPLFPNQLATLELDGDVGVLWMEEVRRDPEGHPVLRPAAHVRLA